MRFTISREKLQEGLAAVAASIPAKTTLPVLANILVETTEDDGGVHIVDLGAESTRPGGNHRERDPSIRDGSRYRSEH